MTKSKFEKKGPSGEIALIALSVEARRRGMSYGKLVPTLTPDEQEEIVQRYRDEKAAQSRPRKKPKQKK